jgi:hypothetical protein
MEQQESETNILNHNLSIKVKTRSIYYITVLIISIVDSYEVISVIKKILKITALSNA